MRGVDDPGSLSMTQGESAPSLLAIVYSTQSQYQQPVPKLSLEESKTAPGEEYKYKYLQPYEPSLLNRAFGNLEKTPVSGIPDFDVSQLAIPPVTRFAGNDVNGLNNGNIHNGNGKVVGSPVNGVIGGNSSTLGGSLLKSVPSSSSLHFNTKINLSNTAATESSNEDATMMRLPLKKKKRKERAHSSVSPTSATGIPGPLGVSGIEGHDTKRRKTTIAIN